MRYISLSDKDKREMLAALGLASMSELFESVPDEVKLKRPLDIPSALSEPELLARLEELASENTAGGQLSFLGAGAYPHYIPAVVDYLSSRGEFVSPYTPYQPEVSQGTLQVIFEFQTLICQLTGMDIANASLYDGASGAAEAVLMAHRLKRRNRVLVSASLHPQYRQVIDTYTRNLEVIVETVDFEDETGRIDLSKLRDMIDENTAAVVCQTPNYFGVIEEFDTVAAMAHEKGGLAVAVVSEPLSLGILKPPGEMGADIVTGEAQSFGLPLSFGGPFLGFMATSQPFIRQFPGRIAGQTEDVDGRRGFVLTLSTREQHIRRERATSNICTNQALCALRATIYLETLGRSGLRELARLNMLKARYAFERWGGVPGVTPRFTAPHFNEFVLRFERPWAEVERGLRDRGILGGLGLGNLDPRLTDCAVICATEVHTRSAIDRMAAALAEVMA